MRRAKIVCTLGPASDSDEVLEKMILAGMNVARLNFSHGEHSYHAELFDRVRRLSRELKHPVSILQDLQGPKIRVGRFEEGFVHLEEGAEFVITSDDVDGTYERVSTTYKELPRDVKPGDTLLLDDGLLRLTALEVRGADVITRVDVGGKLKNNKGINLPTAAVSAPSLTEKDKIDLEFGAQLGVDYMALSFVRSALDIHQMRARMPGGERSPIKVISKIEKPQALNDLDNIIAVSDGVMIARGDLGVELPPQKVPMIQKMIIRRANARARISITATQMLESMTENPRPTRAEASDVANAVLDGTDAVMLSGETAAGKHPVTAIEMMASIIGEVESNPSWFRQKSPAFMSHMKTFPNAVAKAATTAADELPIKAIVVLTKSGATARLMMTYRPTKTIVACTPSEQIFHQLGAFWGVEPQRMDVMQTTEQVLEFIDKMMITERGAKPGDEVIVVMGSPVPDRVETNLIKFHRIRG